LNHAELIARIQAGDRTAEDDLATGFRRQVFVVLLGRISDHETARELTQDVLVAVLKAVREGKVREPDKLPGFMHGVTKNIANNHLRNRSAGPLWVELTEDAAWVDAEEEADMADRRRRLNDAMAGLDPTDRRILALSVVQGLSSQEVAAAVGLTSEATRARKSRALKRLAGGMQKTLSRFGLAAPLKS
jgi:RNA polymerase sigma-70 factor (ECF subfamily)